MSFTLPPLPYPREALAPHISAETLDFHHGKHHNAYLTKLNSLVEADPTLKGKSLEDLVKTTTGAVFNQAAQVWNHTFYWNSMSPTGGGEPTGKLAEAINKAFGNFATFKQKFSDAAAGQFGSGWAWLIKDADGNLRITTTSNAGCPLSEGHVPVLTCDVWEHAYYIDYRNARPNYIAAFWNVVNWQFATANLGCESPPPCAHASSPCAHHLVMTEGENPQ
jgi:Fe-Mn family superoxide dismutase